MSDKPHDKAVRSPWTEGAWIMQEGHVQKGWELRHMLGGKWYPVIKPAPKLLCIVEARPTGGES